MKTMDYKNEVRERYGNTDAYREHEHHGIETNSKHLIRQGYPIRSIADEKKVFQLGSVLLQQEVDAEHEDIER